jgi:ATP-dependent Lon protease
LESRKRVKDQLARIDSTYPEVDFHYVALDGEKRNVTTVEEEEYPQFYHLKPAHKPDAQEQPPVAAAGMAPSPEERGSAAKPVISLQPKSNAAPKLAEGHFVFAENRRGVSYERLFGPYIEGASLIIVTDPYIRIFYQIRNMMEFVEMVIRRKSPEDQVKVHLVTGPDEGNISRQRELLESITSACTGTGVEFSWAFDTSGAAHGRDIVSDTGWKIVLDRGLDIFQPPIKTDGFSLGDRLQDHRMIKGFYVTYVRDLSGENNEGAIPKG